MKKFDYNVISTRIVFLNTVTNGKISSQSNGTEFKNERYFIPPSRLLFALPQKPNEFTCEWNQYVF